MQTLIDVGQAKDRIWKRQSKLSSLFFDMTRGSQDLEAYGCLLVWITCKAVCMHVNSGMYSSSEFVASRASSVLL